MNSESNLLGRAPARLAPIFVPRIWGTHDLSPLFPEHSKEIEPIGEVWLTGNECVFASGEFAGRRSLGNAATIQDELEGFKDLQNDLKELKAHKDLEGNHFLHRSWLNFMEKWLKYGNSD